MSRCAYGRRPLRRRVAWAAAGGIALFLALVALQSALAFGSLPARGPLAAPTVAAQDMEAQALQIERQLLCPRCTNVRLDHCEIAICEDMRHQIREQLEAGETPDNILLFFSNRFGDRVLADLPKEGFNLVLFGWVGGSLLLVATAGALVLRQLRRSARPLPAALSPAEEQWLDSQVASQDPRANGGAPRGEG